MRKIGTILLCFTILCGCVSTGNEESETETSRIVINEDEGLLKKDTCYKYYYEQLSGKKKSVYEQIYGGVVNQEKKIKVEEMSEDDIYEIAELVSYDHPELYYYAANCFYNGKEKSQLVVAYLEVDMSKKEINNALEQTLKDVYTRMPDGASDYDKTRIVYEYMIERCNYDETAKNNQNILSSLVGNQTVCAGYAKGIQFILNEMGIPCSYIVGKEVGSESEEDTSHAWNMVELDNDYYYLDATWGDVIENIPHTCYGYYMMSQAEMLQLYVPDKDTKATLNNNNYFIQKGIYLDEYNESIISNNILQSYHEGQNVVEIKCAPEVYETLEYQLVQNGRIYEIMNANGLYFDQLHYVASPEIHLIEIILN